MCLTANLWFFWRPLIAFSHSYSRYHKWWTVGRIHYDITIPLLRFTSDLQPPVQLSPHRHLAPFTIEEKTLEWNQLLDLMRSNPMEPPLSIDFRAFCLTSFKLTNSFIEQSDEPSGSEDLAQEEEEIITALRLVHAGNVEMSKAMGTNQMPPGPPSFIDSPPDHPLVGFTGYMLSVVFMQESFYVLSQADLPIIQDLCQSLQKLGKQKSGLAVALRYFNRSYDRTHQEDTIIDWTVALESCLLGDMKEELNYRLALRGAALLAQAKLWEPEQAYDLLKEMYTIRSTIVHTGQEFSTLEKRARNKLQKRLQPLIVRLTSREKKTPDVKVPGMQVTISQLRDQMKADQKDHPVLEGDNFFEVLSEFLHYCEDIVRDILRTYVLWLVNGGSVETVCKDVDQYILHSFTGVSNEDTEGDL